MHPEAHRPVAGYSIQIYSLVFSVMKPHEPLHPPAQQNSSARTHNGAHEPANHHPWAAARPSSRHAQLLLGAACSSNLAPFRVLASRRKIDVVQSDVSRDTFGCDNNSSVLVAGGCAGIFQCGNGATTACSGGILGLGEAQVDRAALLVQLANLPTQPESVPINKLVKVAGTPLDNVEPIDEFTFIKSIAITRIMMPKSHVRLSAGREDMSEQTQALCFMAGANSIFFGCKLLTTAKPDEDSDRQLFKKLGINKEPVHFSPSVKEHSVDAAIVRYREKDELFYDATSTV